MYVFQTINANKNSAKGVIVVIIRVYFRKEVMAKSPLGPHTERNRAKRARKLKRKNDRKALKRWEIFLFFEILRISILDYPSGLKLIFFSL